MVTVAGEIATQADIDHDKVVCGHVAKTGFDPGVDDPSDVDSKRICDEACEVPVRIEKS